MPQQRNEQEYEQRRQQIMDGALHVFAGKGFEQATNKDIAAAAGIGSAGLIYHYFKDKADLFRQVVEERMPLLQLIAHTDEVMALPPAEGLHRIGSAYLKVMENNESVALFKLILSEAVRRPKVAQMFSEIGPTPVFRFIAAYLERQMDAGVLRRTDPAVAARAFFSPLIVFVLTREVFQQPDAQRMNPQSYLAGTIDVFLNGMQP